MRQGNWVLRWSLNSDSGSNQAVALGYHGDVFKLVHLADPEDAKEFEREDAGRTLVRAARNFDTLGGKGLPRLAQVLEGAGLEAPESGASKCLEIEAPWQTEPEHSHWALTRSACTAALLRCAEAMAQPTFDFADPTSAGTQR
jgi:hypothetical protein